MKIESTTNRKADTELNQPWKDKWPHNFRDYEEGESERESSAHGHENAIRPNPGPPQGPKGGKGASPLASTMVDGTKVMRLDDKEVLQRILTDTNA